MNILSLHENSQQKALADRLCRIVEMKAGELRNGRLGRRFILDGIRFRLRSSDRNIIYLVDDGQKWFLKMPQSGNRTVIEREVLGATACRKALADEATFRHADVIRASVDHGYILTSALPGRMLNRQLYTAAFSPRPSARSNLCQVFGHLGTALARLHGLPLETNLTVTRTASAGITSALKKTVRPDTTAQFIRRHVDVPSSLPQNLCFAHGNFHLENVLSDGRQLSMIDFENSGRGSQYEDLALLCAQLHCCTAAAHLPSRIFRDARAAFLEGYSSIGHYDPIQLDGLVTLRVCEYYLLGFCSTKSRPTLGGIPVSRKRAQHLVHKSLDALPARPASTTDTLREAAL